MRSSAATLLNRFRRDIGVDLGTANTLVHVAGQGIVLREPSVVAVDNATGQILSVGADAKRMVGRTPSDIVTIRPLKDGVIADYDQTLRMLQHFIRKVTRSPLVQRSVVVGIPSGVTEVERRAVIEASRKAGAHKAYVIEEPMAAAIGAGMPIEEPVGNMIVDIGGGTTEVAVISLAGIVHSRSIRIAGDELDEAISAFLRRAYNLQIGERTAEEIKITIGSAYPLRPELSMSVQGRDMITGLPKNVTVSSEEVRVATAEPINAIIDAVKLTLEATPPELAADCMNHGIVLAGGGALLRGLDQLLADETGMPVIVADDPLSCVAYGTGKVVEAMRDNVAIRRMLERASKV